MRVPLLCVLFFSAFIVGCDNIQSHTNSGREKITSDTSLLRKFQDSITVHSEKKDSAYCDSMLMNFNSVDLAKRYPALVAAAFNAALLTRYSAKNEIVFNQFGDLVDKSGSNYLKAWYNYFIGRSEQNIGNDKQAIQFFLNALPGLEEAKDTVGITACSRRLGSLYRYNASDYKRAIFYYKRNLQITKDSFIIDNALGELFFCYAELKFPDSAWYYLRLLKEWNYKNGEQFFDKVLYYSLDRLDRKTPGSEDSVKKYFTLFVPMHTRNKNYRALIYGHFIYGHTLVSLKRYEEAERLLKQALKYTAVCPDDCLKENGELFSELSNVYDLLGNTPAALKYLKLKNEVDQKFSMANLKTELASGEETFRFKQEQQELNLEKEKKDIELNAERKQKSYLAAGLIILLIFSVIFLIQRNRINKAKKRSDELLLNILPWEIAEELKAKGNADAKQFDDVTVMFTDFRDFTQISEKLSPAELVAEIDYCFKAFDNIIGKHNIEKIKTIGDAYMCVGGLPVSNKTHATDIVNAALEILKFMKEYFQQRLKENKDPFEIRIGVHTGPVVAGIVGLKKFAYDIWGDTVNIASRMESSGEAGKVNISGATFELVKDKFSCNHRGKIQAKHKGEIDMYFVEDIAS